MADDRSIVRSNMAQDAEGGGFLAYYEKAHRDPLNRWTHHAAHALGVIGVTAEPVPSRVPGGPVFSVYRIRLSKL